MVTEKSLKEQYAKINTDDLLHIVANKSGYTELAISVAIKELKSRNISENEITKQGIVIHERENKYWMENCLFDLSFFQKLAYYFILWMSRARYSYSDNFKQEGYLLKVNQSNYYSVLGLLFLIVTFICVIYSNSLLLLFGIWPSGFLLSYLYDINYNKQKQIRNIQKIKDEGELPIEYL